MSKLSLYHAGHVEIMHLPLSLVLKDRFIIQQELLNMLSDYLDDFLTFYIATDDHIHYGLASDYQRTINLKARKNESWSELLKTWKTINPNTPIKDWSGPIISQLMAAYTKKEKAQRELFIKLN